MNKLCSHVLSVLGFGCDRLMMLYSVSGGEGASVQRPIRNEPAHGVEKQCWINDTKRV